MPAIPPPAPAPVRGLSFLQATLAGMIAIGICFEVWMVTSGHENNGVPVPFALLALATMGFTLHRVSAGTDAPVEKHE